MTVVSLHKVTPSRVNYYTIAIAKDDYYTENGEAKGVWLGSGAQELGIDKTAIAFKDPVYQKVMDGVHPNKDQILRNIRGNGVSKPVLGYDFTFSVPKSLSVLYATCSPSDRLEIERSMAEAAKQVAWYIDGELIGTRSGKGGLIKEKAEGVFAAFHHSTSRSLDPQLHTHLIIANSALKKDRSWGAVDGSRFLNKDTKHILQTLASVHANELRHQLEKRLNLITVSNRNDQTFHIEGIPIEIQLEMSKRSKTIAESVKDQYTDKGLTPTPEQKQKIVVATREKKQNITLEDRLKEWQKIAKDLKFNPNKIPKRERKPEKVKDIAELTEKVAVSLHKLGEPFSASTIASKVFLHSGGRFDTDTLLGVSKAFELSHVMKTEEEEGNKFSLNRHGLSSVRDYWMNQASNKNLIQDKSTNHELTMLAKGVKRIEKLRQTYDAYKTDRRRRAFEKLKRQAPFLYLTGRIDRSTYKAITRKAPDSKIYINTLHATYQISSAQRKYYLALLESAERQKLNKQRRSVGAMAKFLYDSNHLTKEEYKVIRQSIWTDSKEEVERTDTYVKHLFARAERSPVPPEPTSKDLEQLTTDKALEKNKKTVTPSKGSRSNEQKRSQGRSLKD
jgi:conjugative relaxase-like TrwC/TraI family protein